LEPWWQQGAGPVDLSSPWSYSGT